MQLFNCQINLVMHVTDRKILLYYFLSLYIIYPAARFKYSYVYMIFLYATCLLFLFTNAKQTRDVLSAIFA